MTGRAPARPQRAVHDGARPKVAVTDIQAALTQLGIGQGDAVLVHSGLSHLGRVEGGAKGVLALLREHVGETGTLLFPAFPFNTLMLGYVKSNPEFDAQNSPARMGMLAEKALKESDRRRSLHTTHCLTALGADADAYAKDHEKDITPFGPNSPYRRLADEGGKILALGVGLKSVTSFHEAEDRMGDEFPVRVYLDETFEMQGKTADGRRYVVKTRCHDPLLSAVRDCNLMQPPLEQAGALKTVPVGAHFAMCLDAAGLSQTLIAQAQKKRTIYGRIWG